jgi:hypothetical protein
MLRLYRQLAMFTDAVDYFQDDLWPTARKGMEQGLLKLILASGGDS